MKLVRHEEVPDLRAYYGEVAALTGGQAQHKIGYIQAHQRERLRIVVDWIAGLAPLERGLEIGCGEGYMTSAIAPYFADLLAVDFQPAFLDQCPVIAGVTYEEHDVEHWTPAGKFDLVTVCEVLEHLVDPIGLLKRLAPHTDRILATCPINEELTAEAWNAAYIDVTKEDAGMQGIPVGAAAGHVWAMDWDGFKSMFEEASLKIECAEVPYPSGIILAATT